MRKIYCGFFSWLDKFDTVASIILVTVMIISIFLQIIFRYLVEDALTWTEELARYAMIFVVYLGVGIGTKTDSHMGVTVVVDLFFGRARKIVAAITYIITIIIYIALFILTCKMVQRAIEAPQYSPAMRIPIFLMYAALPIGFGNAILRLAQKLIDMFIPKADEAKPCRDDLGQGAGYDEGSTLI